MTDAVSSQPVVLGRITGAWGIKGGVRIQPYGDDPANWTAMRGLWIADNEAATNWSRFKLASLRLQGDGVVVQFDGVHDRNAAEALGGRLVGAPRSEMPEPGADEYYWGDLIGLEVVNVQGESIGRVKSLIETGANAVLVVEASDGGEKLLPFVDEVVLKVDVPAGRIDVAWGADW
jgi:16S rRNA processing protein RimM